MHADTKKINKNKILVSINSCYRKFKQKSNTKI